VVITIPASFDETARELTAEAARKAGIENFTMLEEPQAAFYAWLSRNEDNWQELIREGKLILVIDVGGGTTDFTLIFADQKEGKFLRRVRLEII
jgi:molecular chaperone DnaK (HSP70)